MNGVHHKGREQREERQRQTVSETVPPVRLPVLPVLCGERRSFSAFTLVEMLVVMGIVGLLAAVLTEVILTARRMSIQVECQEHMRQIGQTVNQLMLGNSGIYPKLVDDNGVPWWRNVYNQWGGAVPIQLPGALPGAMKIFHCRMAGELQTTNMGSLDASISYGLNFDVMDSDGKPYCVPSYAGTATGGTATTVTDAGMSWGPNQLAGKYLQLVAGTGAPQEAPIQSNTNDTIVVSQVFSPSPTAGTDYRIVVVPASLRFPTALTVADKRADSYSYTFIRRPSEFMLISEANTQGPDPTTWTGGRIAMAATNRNSSDEPPNFAPVVGRHSGKANVLFADMHLAAVDVLPDAGIGKDVNRNTPLWTVPDD